MANPKFTTIKGSGTIATTPFYIGVLQHERTMTKKEAYEYLAEKTGYKATAIRAAFLALKKAFATNANKANISQVEGVVSIRTNVKGSFETISGPWTKGKNYLLLGAVALDPFRSSLSGLTPENNTEGAKPTINTVLDETTKVYDVITGTNTFSIAGSDLGPDTTKADEYVALVSKAGIETKCTITSSDLQNVKAHVDSALEAGEYTLKVYTRSGYGSEFGVKCATRKVTVAAVE